MIIALDSPIISGLASKPRAAIYTRVSTVNQEGGASLTTQKAECTRYAQATGVIVTHEYLDVQSGLKSDRVQYQEMLRAAKEGEFDRIIVWKMDRFGRDRIESGLQLRDLQQLGIRVDSATEPNDSPLLRNILMDFAEEESRRISLRVSANQKTRAQNGRRTSKPPFGYSNVEHPQGGRTLEPNQDAPVVTEVFQRYATGRYSLADLRDYINSASSSPNRPRTRAGIHHLLKNPTYAGINRHGFYARSKIQVKSKSERLAEVFEVDGCFEALVDKDTFQKVQVRMENNRPHASGRPHPSFLFTGFTWCSCGCRYSGKSCKNGTQVIYYCVRKNDAGDCDSRSVSENRIREAVLTPIKKLLEQLSQDDARKAVRQELTRLQSATNKSSGGPEDARKRRDKLEARLSRLEDSYLDGDLGKDRYLIRRDQILAELAEIQEGLATRLQPAMPDLDELFAIADTITVENLDDEAWRDIIEGMVEKVVIEGTGKQSLAAIKVHWKPAFESLIDLTGC